jgi:hypothetical protein
VGFKFKSIIIITALYFIQMPFSLVQAADIKMGYGWSVNPDESGAVKEAFKMLRKTIDKPDLVILLVESSYEKDDLIAGELYKLTNGARIFGLEGSYGVFSNDGIHVGEKGSLAILGIKAPSWSIGVSVKDMSGGKTPMQIKELTIDTIKEAINNAGRTLEDEPDLVLVAPAKLKEEPILNAIEYIFGKNVRISGGTPGGAISIANDRAIENGFSIAVIYADTKIGAGFHAGIAVDKAKSGIVTAMGDSPRVIKEINNRPAFEAYRKWAEGGLDDVDTSKKTDIWSRSYALVRVYNLADNEMGTKVVVPISVNPDLSMVTGADISEGENLYFATASRQAYVKRAGTIVGQALLDGNIKYSELVGGIHFYCRGAAFSQFGRNRENLQALVDETNKKIKERPYIGTFTAGEQGNIKGYGIFMGNLTSSMAVFGNK